MAEQMVAKEVSENLSRGSSTIAKHLPHCPKVEAYTPDPVAGTGSEKGKKELSGILPEAEEQWQNTCLIIPKSRISVQLLLLAQGEEMTEKGASGILTRGSISTVTEDLPHHPQG